MDENILSGWGLRRRVVVGMQRNLTLAVAKAVSILTNSGFFTEEDVFQQFVGDTRIMAQFC